MFKILKQYIFESKGKSKEPWKVERDGHGVERTFPTQGKANRYIKNKKLSLDHRVKILPVFPNITDNCPKCGASHANEQVCHSCGFKF